jgi:periplasmic protein CpxP/Spy
MKNTLRLLAAAAALAVALPAVASAQGGGWGGGGGMQQMSPEQRLARTKETLFAGITLTAEQTARMDTILVQGMRKQQEMMQAAMAGGDRSAMRETMQKMTKERDDAIKAVLTDEQKKKFEENLANMPQGRRGGF